MSDEVLSCLLLNERMVRSSFGSVRICGISRWSRTMNICLDSLDSDISMNRRRCESNSSSCFPSHSSFQQNAACLRSLLQLQNAWILCRCSAKTPALCHHWHRGKIDSIVGEIQGNVCDEATTKPFFASNPSIQEFLFWRNLRKNNVHINEDYPYVSRVANDFVFVIVLLLETLQSSPRTSRSSSTVMLARIIQCCATPR